jgi:hypothetical protein
VSLSTASSAAAEVVPVFPGKEAALSAAAATATAVATAHRVEEVEAVEMAAVAVGVPLAVIAEDRSTCRDLRAHHHLHSPIKIA